ncbi:hypothetical protein B0A55_06492 [Friedmanniomyces simplex]|uniref:Uncharacterized protein n=1 Tax=Friedmanniomyces simplex TaxID=329884 RepID=A0A4U0X9H4_9PEZI|nr:hypothetical protein B0A55_06492 [Friedmanniomyces simplex]
MPTLSGQSVAAKPAASRPSMVRATTTSAQLSTAKPTPLLSRPLMSRPTTTLKTPTALRPSLSQRTSTASNPPTRPSLLRRATDLLELNPSTSYAHRHAPATPSHWTEHAHRESLLRVWDTVHAAATAAPSPSSSSSAAKDPTPSSSLTAQVLETEKQILLEFAELGEGDVVLGTEWVEYKLELCLRRPFCTAERMGRFEVLAASAGGRGNWGPW